MEVKEAMHGTAQCPLPFSVGDDKLNVILSLINDLFYCAPDPWENTGCGSLCFTEVKKKFGTYILSLCLLYS